MGNRKAWTPPDGGYGWVIVVAVFFMNFLATGCVGTFGVLYVEFMESFDISKSAAAMFQTCACVAFALSAVLCGPLIKIYNCRLLTVIGTIITFSGFMISYFVQTFYLLYLTYGITTGFGMGFIYVSAAIAPQQYFDKKRGIAGGITSAGIGIGLLLWPFLTHVTSQTYGWQGSMLVFSALILNGLPCAALLRPIPKDTDLESDTDTKKSSSFFLTLLRSGYDCSVLKNKPLLVLFLSVFVYQIGHLMAFLFTVARAVYSGIDKDHATYLAVVLGICTTVSRPTMGFIGDCKSVNRTIMYGCCFIMAGVCSVVSYWFTTYAQMMVYVVAFGLMSGAFISLLYPVTVDLIGVENISYATGILVLLLGIASIITPAIGGVLGDLTNQNLPFLIAGCFKILGGIVALCVYFVQKQQQRLKKLMEKDMPQNIEIIDITTEVNGKHSNGDLQ